MNYTIWIYSETIHFTHHYFDNLSAPDLHWRNWQCKEQRVQHTQSEWKSGLWTLRYTVLQDCRYILLPFSSSNCFTQSVYTVRGLDALNIKHAGKSRAELFPFLYDVWSFKFPSVASRLFRTIVIREFQFFLNLVNKTCITYPETPKFFTWMLEGLINPNIQLFLGEVKRGLQRTKSASESPKIREFQALVTPCHCGENPSDQSKLTRVTGAFCHENGRSSSPRANTRPRHKFLRRGSYITFINKSKKIAVFSSILWAKMWVLNKLWPSSRSWLSIYIPLTCFLLLIFWDS